MKSGRIKLRCHNGLHLRPAGIIVKIAELFPNTTINVFKGVGRRYREGQVCNAKSVNQMVWEGGFVDDEEVTLEVDGEAETLAFEFIKIAWENFSRFSDPEHFDTQFAEKNIFAIIDDRFLATKTQAEIRILDRAADSITAAQAKKRFLAITNDRLHRLAVYAMLRA